MTEVNIAGIEDIDDMFYRYKRKELEINKQKNKTSIINLEDVANNLKRETLSIIEFFKRKQGLSFSRKKGIFTTTKIVSKDELEKYLREYIEEYVLCKRCKFPETDLVVESDRLYAKCKCCSHTFEYLESGKNSKIVSGTIKLYKKLKLK